MTKPDNCILVIFGASGDLTRRKLIPALLNLHKKNLLPEKFAVLGVSRTPMSDASFREALAGGVEDSDEKPDPDEFRAFAESLYYLPLDTGRGEDYGKLAQRLRELDDSLQTGGNYIYYLAIAPSMYEPIVENLGAAGLQKEESPGQAVRRIIVEKPFGYDLASARALNRKLLEVFNEPQVYRIDHYLGKETVQNLLVFRFSNGIFEPLWNRHYIDYVEITAAETVGVGARGQYYDSSGALRDMVQNHLLQILGFVAMEPPPLFDAFSVRNETVKVFQSFKPIPQGEVDRFVVRGQYTRSKINGQAVPGYREERHVDPQSRTETFVAMKVFVDNWRWGGVPFYIRTGKRLPTRVTEVVIHFKTTPHILFQHKNDHVAVPNQLLLRIQPDEGILLNFGMKRPGAGFHVERVSMDFHYSDLGCADIADAYERLLLDCMQGDATLFTRGDAVEACWRFVDPILTEWKQNPDGVIYGYPAGTWGPSQANQVFPEAGMDWHYPCRDLVENGQFCEL